MQLEITFDMTIHVTDLGGYYYTFDSIIYTGSTRDISVNNAYNSRGLGNIPSPRIYVIYSIKFEDMNTGYEYITPSNSAKTFHLQEPPFGIITMGVAYNERVLKDTTIYSVDISFEGYEFEESYDVYYKLTDQP